MGYIYKKVKNGTTYVYDNVSYWRKDISTRIQVKSSLPPEEAESAKSSQTALLLLQLPLLLHQHQGPLDQVHKTLMISAINMRNADVSFLKHRQNWQGLEVRQTHTVQKL